MRRQEVNIIEASAPTGSPWCRLPPKPSRFSLSRMYRSCTEVSECNVKSTRQICPRHGRPMRLEECPIPKFAWYGPNDPPKREIWRCRENGCHFVRTTNEHYGT